MVFFLIAGSIMGVGVARKCWLVQFQYTLNTNSYIYIYIYILLLLSLFLFYFVGVLSSYTETWMYIYTWI